MAVCAPLVPVNDRRNVDETVPVLWGRILGHTSSKPLPNLTFDNCVDEVKSSQASFQQGVFTPVFTPLSSALFFHGTFASRSTARPVLFT